MFVERENLMVAGLHNSKNIIVISWFTINSDTKLLTHVITKTFDEVQ
jgi:hypothetical protein